jgi:hypothetical protein
MHFARIVLAVAWTGDSMKLPDRVLEPGERISEILFGLIMALTVTLVARQSVFVSPSSVTPICLKWDQANENPPQW